MLPPSTRTSNKVKVNKVKVNKDKANKANMVSKANKVKSNTTIYR